MQVQDRLSSPPVMVAGPPLQEVNKVALCCGSGANLLEAARRSGSQALLSGGGKYHDARKAESPGLFLLDVGHFASERILVPRLAQRMEAAAAERGWRLEVNISWGERSLSGADIDETWWVMGGARWMSR